MGILNVFCSFALIISATLLSAQSGNQGKNWRPGYVITQQSDTIRGMLQIEALKNDSNYDFQHSLLFDNGKRKGSYTPDSLQSFTYFEKAIGKGPQITYDKTKNPERDGWVFAKRYVQGACSVFGYTSTRMNMAPGDVALYHLHETKYIQIGNLAVAVHEEDFEEYLIQLFSKCPLILSKLKSKVYEPRNWMKMVLDYNAGKCK